MTDVEKGPLGDARHHRRYEHGSIVLTTNGG